MESFDGVKFKISYSVQSPATDTIAVSENNLPLRNNKGNLIFRPGGHGALLANLGGLDADFIFVKNIDNIAPRPMREKNLPYKKLLGGIAFKIREEILTILNKIEKEELTDTDIENVMNYCSETDQYCLSEGHGEAIQKEKNRRHFFRAEPSAACLRHGEKCRGTGRWSFLGSREKRNANTSDCGERPH